MHTQVGDLGSTAEDLKTHDVESFKGVVTAHGKDNKKISAAIKRVDVVLTTCAGAGAKASEGINVSLVIVDEATQLSVRYCGAWLNV